MLEKKIGGVPFTALIKPDKNETWFAIGSNLYYV